MQFIFGILGIVLGIILWSSILGSIFATLPLRISLKKQGNIKNLALVRNVVAPVVFSGSILVVVSLLSYGFLYGQILAGIITLFLIPKLKLEALEKFRNSSEAEDAKS